MGYRYILLFLFIFILPAFFTFPNISNAFLGSVICDGPDRGTDTGYTSYPDYQFYCPSGSTTGPYQCYEDFSFNRVCTNLNNPSTSYNCTGLVPIPIGNLFTGCSGGGTNPPTVSLSASSYAITSGQTVTLQWTVANAESCSAQGAWSGSKNFSDGTYTESLTLYNPPSTYSFGLSCTNSYDTTLASPISITVNPPPDTTPPSAPTALSANAVSSSQINLLWAASSDSGGSGMAGYIVYQCQGAGCTNFSSIISLDPAAISYSNTGIAPSTLYRYYIEAFDEAENTAQSAIAEATTLSPPDTTPPSAPSLSGSAFSSTQINLFWTASTDNVGVFSYRVYRNSVLIATLGTFTLSYQNIGLNPATSYSYYVIAYDAAGYSTQSNTISISTDPAPDTTPPTFTFTSPLSLLPAGTTSTNLSGTASESSICRYSDASGQNFDSMMSMSPATAASSSQINLSWTASTDNIGVAGYRVYRNGIQVATASGTFYSDTGLTPSTAYSYYVIAYDAAGNLSPQSNTASATTSSSISAALTATAATNFTVLISGLTNGSTYTYFVKCRDASNNTSGDFPLSFSVDSPMVDTAPPVISGGQPSGALSANTVSVTMSVRTNEPAYCNYNQNSDAPFGSMTSVLVDDSAQTYHSIILSGLTNSASYLYYIRCQDNPGGNENTAGYPISFSVAMPPNALPVASFIANPLSGDAPLPVSVNASASYDTDGAIASYVWQWGDGTPDGATATASHT